MSQNKANPSQRDTNVWLKAECGSVSGGFENNYTYCNDIMGSDSVGVDNGLHRNKRLKLS